MHHLSLMGMMNNAVFVLEGENRKLDICMLQCRSHKNSLLCFIYTNFVKTQLTKKNGGDATRTFSVHCCCIASTAKLNGCGLHAMYYGIWQIKRSTSGISTVFQIV